MLVSEIRTQTIFRVIKSRQNSVWHRDQTIDLAVKSTKSTTAEKYIIGIDNNLPINYNYFKGNSFLNISIYGF